MIYNMDESEPGVENFGHQTILAALYCLRRLRFALSFFIPVTLVLLPFPSPSPRAKTKNILILNSYHKGFKWTDAQVSAAKQVLVEKAGYIEIYVEYMDTKRIYTAEYLETFRRLLSFFHLTVFLRITKAGSISQYRVYP